MTLSLSQTPEYHAEKYCNGCKRWLPVEKFGLRSATRSKLSTRCMECKAESTRKYYYEHFDRISERKRQYWARDHPPKPKHVFIKLTICQDPDTLLRKCPHCGGMVNVLPDQTEGFCQNKGKMYFVKRHLSAVKLEAPFEKRDYEGEILNFINKKGKTYASEIVSGASISKGKVSQVLTKLIGDGLLRSSQQGRFRWVEIRSEYHNREIKNNPCKKLK